MKINSLEMKHTKEATMGTMQSINHCKIIGACSHQLKEPTTKIQSKSCLRISSHITYTKLLSPHMLGGSSSYMRSLSLKAQSSRIRA